MKSNGFFATVWALVFGGLVAAPTTAHAADKCLTGASAASDQAAIEYVRTAVETRCDCDAFDGIATGKKHGNYVKCAKNVIKAKVTAGRLRQQCKGSVIKVYAKSACGFKPTSRGVKVPCVKKITSSGKVICAIKPLDTCTDQPGSFTQAACTDSRFCLDAADSNGNLLIDAADAGTCTEVLGPVVGTATDIPSSAEPANTPGSPGVDVTNDGLITQFGGAEFSLNNALYTRYRFSRLSETPDAILVLIPGFTGGAGSFAILSQNLLPRVRTDEGLVIEVWAVDRRTNQLEDLAGTEIAEDLEDPQIVLDWMFGDDLGLPLSPELTNGPNRRANFYNAHGDLAFMANWTNLVFSQDIDAVVEAARAKANNSNVFLGGHSAGTGFTARYAATDFDLTGAGPADPGYAKLRGLVLLEGGGGSTSGSVSSDTLDRIEAKFDGGLFGAVKDNAPRCVDGVTPCTIATEAVDCTAFTPPKCTETASAYATGLGLLALNPRLLGSVGVAGIQGMQDPEGGQSILQVDQLDTPGNNAIATVADLGLLAALPASNAAASVGNFFDDDGLTAQFAPFVSTSLGAPGPVVGGLATWRDLDDSGSFPSCPGAGCVTPNNGAAPTSLPAGIWGMEKEVTRMDRIVKALIGGGTNFTDSYYPNAGPSVTRVSGKCTGLSGTCTVGNVGASCSGGTQAQADAQCDQGINLDSTALSVGRGRPDIENLTQAANIDIPVICFGGSNGLTTVPGAYVPFGQSIGTCTAPSCDGSTARIVDAALPNPAFPTVGGINGGFEVYISEGFGHLDIVTAQDDASNNVVGPLTAFIARNVVP